jgi:hypothetical protein
MDTSDNTRLNITLSVRLGWRRVVLIALIAVSLIGLYRLAVLVGTSAKVLGFSEPFDSWRGPIMRETVSIGTIEADRRPR